MRKKKTCGVFASVAGVFILTACNCQGVSDDTVTLTIWVSEADKAFAEAVAKEFEEKHFEKKYRFVIDIQGENDVATRVLKDVESAADVFSCANDQLPLLVNGDALAKVAGERLERIRKENTTEALDSVTLRKNDTDNIYGMPYTDNTFFLYYDRSVFTEEDVQSVDAILNKCTNERRFAFPMTDGWYTTSFFFGKGLGYRVVYDSDLAEQTIECDFDSEVGRKVTEAMWSYAKDTRVKADANDSKITAGFSDGSIAAAVSGIWNRKAIENALGDRFAAAKLPTYTYDKGNTDEQVQLVSFAGYKLLGVNNYSKHKTDALDFAEFYTDCENQIKHFDARGFVPTNVAAREEERIKSDVCATAVTRQLAYSKTQKDVPSTLWLPMEGLGTAMLTGIQNGVFDVKGQIEACVRAIEK